MSAPLQARPKAETFRISTLLELARSGGLRIPNFQRPIRWQREHNIALVDSVISGYPVGNLLFWERSAPAELTRFGSFEVHAPATSRALYVIDGQQRITALAGTLCHPRPGTRPGDPYDVYYDLEHQRLSAPTARGPGALWVPLREFADPRYTWMSRQRWWSERPELVDRALAISEALRNSEIPGYVVQSTTDAALRVIFKRLNTSGVGMRDSEVFDALHGDRSEPHGSVAGVCTALEGLGMGRVDEETVLRSLFATSSVDPRRRSADEYEALAAPMELGQVHAALSRAIVFLRDDVGLPSLALLPYRAPLSPLARFFHLFPDPHPRNRVLLRRWFWRGCLDGAFQDTSNPAMRALLSALTIGDEHHSTQRLLGTVATGEPTPDLSSPWRRDSAVSRLVTLALLDLRPLALSGEPLDTAAAHSVGALATTRLLDTGPKDAANRILLPEPPPLADWTDLPEVVCASHAISGDARRAIREGDAEGVWNARRESLRALLRRFGQARAEWNSSDRPPLDAIVADA